MQFPTLNTSRLLIRPFVMDDLALLHPILNAGFGEKALEEREKWLEWTILGYDRYASLYQPPYGDRAIVLRESGQLIGAVGIVPSFGAFETLPTFRQRLAVQPSQKLGPAMGLYWVIDADQRGQGYATEAARAVTTYLFDVLHLQVVVATTEDDNLASIGVMRKLGMIIDRNPRPTPEWFQTVGILYPPE